MKQATLLTSLCAFALALNVQAQSVTFDFEDGTDQGWGSGFGGDGTSEEFPIVNIGGSLRMEVLRDGGFQEASHASGSNPFLAAMNAATSDPTGYLISYDWYVDTSLSPGNYGSFLQLGTYINGGTDPFPYVQDFPGTGKDVELDGVALASGQVFSGTVSETVAAKYGALSSDWDVQTFMRLGLIINGDGADAKVYFDNISVTPVPEPSTFALLGLGGLLLAVRRRRH